MSDSGTRLAVFEATNNARRENVVILSTLSLEDVRRHLRAATLPDIAEWMRGECDLKLIAVNLPKEGVEQFMSGLIESLRAPDWKSTVLML